MTQAVSDEVERVARAIVAVFGRDSPDIARDLRMDWQTWEPEARAAIAAMRPHAPDVKALVDAARGVEGRVYDAMKMYHDATRWGGEDDPDGNGSLRDYVFRELHAALAPFKDRDMTK